VVGGQLFATSYREPQATVFEWVFSAGIKEWLLQLTTGGAGPWFARYLGHEIAQPANEIDHLGVACVGHILFEGEAHHLHRGAIEDRCCTPFGWAPARWSVAKLASLRWH